jgi:hypothetical protein
MCRIIELLSERICCRRRCFACHPLHINFCLCVGVCESVCRKWLIDMKDKLPVRASRAALIPSSEHDAWWFLLNCIDGWIMFIGPVVYVALEKLDSFVTSLRETVQQATFVLIYIRGRVDMLVWNAKWSVSFQWLLLGICCGLLVRYTQH